MKKIRNRENVHIDEIVVKTHDTPKVMLRSEIVEGHAAIQQFAYQSRPFKDYRTSEGIKSDGLKTDANRTRNSHRKLADKQARLHKKNARAQTNTSHGTNWQSTRDNSKFTNDEQRSR